MEFLRLLEGVRTPFFDTFFSTVTHLGEETLFLAIAIFVFWCIGKREGYYLLCVGFVGTVVNQFLKLSFKIPRPFDLDPTFSAVESAIPEAQGYSFPSGHTQNIAGTFGAIAVFSRKVWCIVLSVIIILTVAFSRMYLGVHTPLDVSVSLGIAAMLVFAFAPLFTEKRFDKCMPYVVGACLILGIAFAVYVHTLDPAGFVAKNYTSGLNNSASILGCLFGLAVVYPLDRFCIKFDTRAAWYAQIFKLVLGLALVLAIKEGLKIPLGLIPSAFAARSVRYFLVVLFGGAVYPLTFKLWTRIKIPALDKFTEKMLRKN